MCSRVMWPFKCEYFPTKANTHVLLFDHELLRPSLLEKERVCVFNRLYFSDNDRSSNDDFETSSKSYSP